MKKKIMWGCGGLFGATVLLTMIAAIVLKEPSKDVQKKQAGTETQSVKKAEPKATPEEVAQRELYEQRQRERQFAEEEERSKSETAGVKVEPNSYYNFFADGSCKSSGSTVCLERDAFQALCRKTKRFQNEIFDVLAEYDSTVLALKKNMGYSAFTDVVVYDLDKKAPCAIDFYAKGALNGNSIQKHYACPVITIKSDNEKVLSASSISPLACINPK